MKWRRRRKSPTGRFAAILNIGQRAKHPLFVTNIDDTRLDDIAAWTYRAPVEDQARLGFAIAHALDDSAPAVEGLSSELKGKIDVIRSGVSRSEKTADCFRNQRRQHRGDSGRRERGESPERPRR
ncbi:NADH-ubiquinone oxidoreductase subunit G [Klebsiella michiganensis]|uniref:NADH-ubiquinone oxidoreductase subunit G n=1 Tax=Klebsiella michiganensis TaxID=1134687 RepID=A0A7H4PP83_9ENTR|nr:NADH-ubiquinone oxidoreductase subunit G [Klebsiella michiganensis]